MEDFWIEHRRSISNYSLPHHYEHTYQVLVMLEGRIRYTVQDKSYELTRGDLIVLNTLEEHSLTVLDYPYDRIIFQINPTWFQRDARYPELISIFVRRPPDFSHRLTLPDPLFTQALSMIREMENEYTAQGLYWKLYVGSDLRRLFILILRHYGGSLTSEKPSSGSAIAYRVLSFLDSHYTEDLTVESVASELFLNKHYVAHVFKDETGYSLMDYVTKLRINHAKALLSESALSVSEISAACGYTDFTYFSKVFKKHTGLSPRAFRKDPPKS